jgi:hypothetical protein
MKSTMRNLLVLAVMIIVLRDHAKADFRTGNQLLDDCYPERGPFCIGYIVAIFDALRQQSKDGKLIGWRACDIPGSVTGGQVADIVTKALREHPETRHLAAPSLVAEALAQAFPCRPAP